MNDCDFKHFAESEIPFCCICLPTKRILDNYNILIPNEAKVNFTGIVGQHFEFPSGF